MIVWIIIDLWVINGDKKEALVPYYLEPLDKEKHKIEEDKKKAK